MAHYAVDKLLVVKKKKYPSSVNYIKWELRENHSHSGSEIRMSKVSSEEKNYDKGGLETAILDKDFPNQMEFTSESR